MWVRNFYTFLSALFLCFDTSSTGHTPTDYTPPLQVRSPSGEWGPSWVQNTSMYQGRGSGLLAALNITKGTAYTRISEDTYAAETQSIGIAIGSGSAPETYEDYKMDSLITSGFGTPTKSIDYTELGEDGNLKTSVSFAIVRTGSEVTVNEIGIYLPIGKFGSSGTSYPASPVLAYREVLPEPITLETNDSLVFHVDLDGAPINYTPYN